MRRFGMKWLRDSEVFFDGARDAARRGSKVGGRNGKQTSNAIIRLLNPAARCGIPRRRRERGLTRTSGLPDLVENPRAGERPVVFDRGNRNAEDPGCFLIRHTDEITQFDHLGLEWMVPGQSDQCLMNGQ
jgi:hypothetical protein